MSDDKRLYKIGEVCRMADVQPYVLRYWETEFPPLAPNKSGGGQRLYTQREIDIVMRIKQLLYSEGFTIAGAKKKLETELAGGALEGEVASPPAGKTNAAVKPDSDVRRTLANVKKELSALLKMLQR
ncbi:MAG: MerR family transcriptional regulator [Thermoanaerobaculia bacterium]